MPRRKLDPNALGMDEDFPGNNAAFTCPACGKVFLVSSELDQLGRVCPNPACEKSFGLVVGSAKRGGTATLEWPGHEGPGIADHVTASALRPRPPASSSASILFPP